MDKELLKNLPGWGDVIGVWLDVEHGRPIMGLLMLPGAKTQLSIGFMVVDRAFFLLVGDSPEKISLGAEELLLMLSRGNVDIGLHTALLDRKNNVRLLYNWLSKAVKNGGYIQRLTVVDVDGEPLLESELMNALDGGRSESLRKLLELLLEWHGKALKEFKESDDSSLELQILGPTYLLKG
jgi:hypothetical protein